MLTKNSTTNVNYNQIKDVLYQNKHFTAEFLQVNTY